MNTTITIDIETIPSMREDVRAYFAKTIGKDTAEKLANVRAPANYKDQAKIDEYIQKAKQDLIDGEQAAIDEAVNKTGLDGAFGQIVCVGVALGDAAPVVLSGMDEPDLLNRLNAHLGKVPANQYLSTSIVGHNVSSFDLRFLMQRYIVNGIRPHQLIKLAAEAKPWEKERVYDTMVQFAGIGNRISLDKLCMALGLPGKGDITGADVWPMVQAGRLEEVAAYCADDVAKTRAVFKRMTFAAA
jgi:DNA polymerase elongation subunit (family B)